MLPGTQMAPTEGKTYLDSILDKTPGALQN